MPSSSKRVGVDVVKKSNTLDVQGFEASFLDAASHSYEVQQGSHKVCFDIAHFNAASLPSQDFESCFDLIRTTSMTDYKESSIGWSPSHKRREMKDSLMHYLIVRRRAENDNQDGSFEGFLSLMLTYDSLPCVPVLYIYEIHLAETTRRLGLGTKLLSVCNGIASKVGVAKIMLTCFLSNTNACQFYAQHGFEKDACSPEDRLTRNKVIKADHCILSKRVKAG